MRRAVDRDDGTGRPDPAAVGTPAEFTEGLRRLKRWTGMGYRQLEKRARTAGDVLPRSTLTVALSRNTLPREDLVVTFVRACGGDDEEIQRWVSARRRIAAGAAAPPDVDTAADPDGPRGALAGLVPAPLRRMSWPVRLGAVALIVAAAILVPSLVRDRTGPDGSDPAGSSAGGTPASPGSNPSWAQVRTGTSVTLTDSQTIDFDSGTVGDENLAGRDVGLFQRGDRLTATYPAELALLDTTGEHALDRCRKAVNWDGLLNGVQQLNSGRDICVRTTERRGVMITIDIAPDTIVDVLTFHYTVWERR